MGVHRFGRQFTVRRLASHPRHGKIVAAAFAVAVVAAIGAVAVWSSGAGPGQDDDDCQRNTRGQSCGSLTPDGGSPILAPAPTVASSPTPTATAVPTPTPPPAATSTPVATPAPSPIARPAASPTPTPAPTPSPTPEPPAVTVAGPLLVFYEVMEVSETLRDHRDARGKLAARTRDETRRVYVYDVATDQYWVALDYPHTVIRETYSDRLTVLGTSVDLSAVRVAGSSLVVRSGNNVRRVSLAGETERVLFEHNQISWVEVSPDGTKVAIMYGAATIRSGRGAVLVLDVATGRELLHTERRFDPIFIDDPSDRSRQRWHGDGTALLFEEERQPGLLRLGGEFDVLPRDWILSPDLRYALRVGVELGYHFGSAHTGRDSFEVLDVEDGRVLWSVQAEEGGALLQYFIHHGDTWWQRSQSHVDTSGALDIVAFRELAADSGWRVREGAPWGDGMALSVATGEVTPLTADVEELLRGRAWSNCGRARLISRHACQIQYDGRTIWEGTSGWLESLGVVEPTGDIEIRGITLIDVAVEPDPPPPPPREEMEGPLLLYEVHSAHPTQPRLAIAYDEGTGRRWSLHRRARDPSCSPQAADGGMVTCSGQDVLYIAVDGEAKTLVSGRFSPGFGVAPDGARVAVALNSDVLVLEIRSGDEILRVESADTYQAFTGPGQERYRGSVWLAPWGENSWSGDGTALVTWIGDGGTEVPGAILRLDGEVIPLPRDLEADGSNLSPDTRYIVRGRPHDSKPYTSNHWQHIDVIDFGTDRVLWSLETEIFLQDDHWEWASPTEFAWSSGSSFFHFELQRPDWNAERADISVIDVTTGEIEVMDSADYLASFHPPPRATTECPGHPARPCKILLDGEVIGEGRLARIIGFIGLSASGQSPRGAEPNE